MNVMTILPLVLVLSPAIAAQTSFEDVTLFKAPPGASPLLGWNLTTGDVNG